MSAPNQSSGTTGVVVFDHTRGHTCHCIGCCRKCGGCRTAPWHTADYCRRMVEWLARRPKP